MFQRAISLRPTPEGVTGFWSGGLLGRTGTLVVVGFLVKVGVQDVPADECGFAIIAGRARSEG